MVSKSNSAKELGLGKILQKPIFISSSNRNLTFNVIEAIEDYSFWTLSSLKYLYLSSNRLLSVNTNTFAGLIRLERIFLDGNELTTVSLNDFAIAPSLKLLHLGWNQLEKIILKEQNSTLPKLRNLEHLILNGNNLSPDYLRFFNLSRIKSL
ncbi:Leucine-rich repeat neuronal protein 2 [Trichoplax sp. H2]|nr:Leucine-rich repeat neuronal protein 2 [Trichoplax sp. H2]|eukprot:RDD45094.1 Leucine-rich repeat neuronal protein 2 [Trichoplax sp. H2]